MLKGLTKDFAKALWGRPAGTLTAPVPISALGISSGTFGAGSGQLAGAAEPPLSYPDGRDHQTSFACSKPPVVGSGMVEPCCQYMNTVRKIHHVPTSQAELVVDMDLLPSLRHSIFLRQKLFVGDTANNPLFRLDKPTGEGGVGQLGANR